MQELNIDSTQFETLAFHRMKFLQLLNEGGSQEELESCQLAIQCSLAELSLSRTAAMRREKANRQADRSHGHLSVFLRTFFSRFSPLAKAH
jgi:hypothetical protein